MTRSRIPVPDGSDFPLENLPYGVFDPGDGTRIGVAIGSHVLDLRAARSRLPGVAADALAAATLNPYLALGRVAWLETREAITHLLSSDEVDRLPDGAIHEMGSVRMLLPFEPGDYVDFYSSIEHATNLGRMFRPDSEPLLPNWRHLPVGYHGRASSVVVSGTPITRPSGQIKPVDGPPIHSPTRALDIELEVGFVTGPGNDLGHPIPISEARDHIFGLVLVNDWSARDIQRWEYQPLGPFLGKSFATAVSPWVVTLDALAPYMVASPAQDPLPLDYLRTEDDWGIDLELEVLLAAQGMTEPVPIARTNFSGMYWTMAQQLAHVTVNGTNVRPGDLYASGTVSGSETGSYGSLIELTWGGENPIALPDGSERRFVEDGDTVILRGWCQRPGLPRIGFGECTGTVVTAPRV
ncbi:MAG TPA: fumarylacetoacetase [Acidimicrobiia bacterium]|nr:fumarylacetoacetase [Acidimicrobiia bacterium]